MIQKSHTNLLPIQNPLFWFSVTLSFLVGSTINLLPVTFKVFQKLFQAGFEMQGQVNLFYFMGAILGNVLAGFLTTRIGAGLSVRVGLVLGSLGCLMLAFSQNFFMVQTSAALMGMGSVWLMIIFGTLTAEHFQGTRQRIFAVLLGTMAIGGTLAPLALGAYISNAWMEWKWPWWIPYIILTGFYLLTLLNVPLALKKSEKSRVKLKITMKPLLQFLKSLKLTLWLIGLASILHGIGQMGAVVWLGRLYAGRLPLSETQVAWMISVNTMGFIMGRVVWTFFGGRLPDRILLAFSAGLGSIFYTFTIFSDNYLFGLIFIFVAGMAMSGDAISLQSFTALRFRQSAAKAFGFTQALGYLGAGAGPMLMGYVGERSGSLEESVWMIPLTIASLSVLGLSWHFLDRSKKVLDS